jgi:hypothetical protein
VQRDTVYYFCVCYYFRKYGTSHSRTYTVQLFIRSPSPAQNEIRQSLLVEQVNYSNYRTTASASHNTIYNSMSLADMQSSQQNLRSVDQPPMLYNLPRRSQSSRARASVSRWLLITTVKLLISTPDNVLRLVTFFCACELTRGNKSFMDYFVVAARLLYFAQFWSNAAYLTTVFRNKGRNECQLTDRFPKTKRRITKGCS